MCQLQCHLCQSKEIEWHIVDGKHEVKEHPERPGSNTHGNILFLDEQSIWIPKQGLGPGQHGRGNSIFVTLAHTLVEVKSRGYQRTE